MFRAVRYPHDNCYRRVPPDNPSGNRIRTVQYLRTTTARSRSTVQYHHWSMLLRKGVYDVPMYWCTSVSQPPNLFVSYFHATPHGLRSRTVYCHSVIIYRKSPNLVGHALLLGGGLLLGGPYYKGGGLFYSKARRLSSLYSLSLYTKRLMDVCPKKISRCILVFGIIR